MSKVLDFLKNEKDLWLAQPKFSKGVDVVLAAFVVLDVATGAWFSAALIAACLGVRQWYLRHQ